MRKAWVNFRVIVFVFLGFLLATSSCRKTRVNSDVAGKWRCNGSEQNRYYYDSAVRAWNGTDSFWSSVPVFTDSLVAIVNKIVEVRRIDDARFDLTSLAYDGEWKDLKLDTVSYVVDKDGVKQYSVRHLSVRNQGYSIDLFYDAKNDRINIVYEWSVIGPNYNDVGSKITLAGMRD